MLSRRDLLESMLVVPAASALFPCSSVAQGSVPSAQPRWLEDIAKQLQAEFNLPAVWVAANIEGKVEAAVVGVRKMGDPTLATLDDKLTVASISKPMAGLWIATLVNQGKLTYETKVLDVLPEFASACLPEHRDITLGQLLTHTAGVIRDAAHIPDNLKLEQYPAERLREAKEVLSSPSPPGSKGKEVYSNNGVTLAVTMAEKVAGESYETAAGRFYTERLGLKSWGVWPMNLADDLTLPWPHTMKNKTPAPQPPRSVQFQFVRPSGSAHCTITDLARFGLIAGNSSPISKSLLKAEIWQRILESGENARTTLCCFYAGGLDFPVFDHGGSLGITSSHLRVLPHWKIAYAFHTNAAGDEFRNRGIELMQIAVRKIHAKRNPVNPCRITLTEVTTVDTTWKNEIAPKVSDDKLRIRVKFTIEASPHTGDLQASVKLGEDIRRYDYFNGLAAAKHELHYEFDMPKNKKVTAVVTIDSLETAGNTTPRNASFESTLTLN